MNLQEQISRVKEMMGLNEQVTSKPTSLNFERPKQSSDYLGKGGGFEREIYQGNDAQEYAKILASKRPQEIKKIRLIFPVAKWEQVALNLVKKLGIISGVFTSLGSAKRFVTSLVKKGVKADELVIGSHGRMGTLLITRNGKEYRFDNSFLLSFKNLLQSNTKVFFTACHGADYLDSLKDAAEKLGVGVYGSSGIYNYVTNSSEKGYYWCSANKFELPTSKEKIEGYGYIDNNILINLLDRDSNSLSKINGTITIKNGVFNKPVPTLSFISYKNNTDEFGKAVRGSVLIHSHIIRPQFEIFNYYHLNGLSDNPYSQKQNELSKQNRDMPTYIKDKIESNEIVVEIELNGKKVNVKSLPSFFTPTDVTNEFLLQNGLCKKVNNAPISWFNT